jgi:hypothetical protein
MRASGEGKEGMQEKRASCGICEDSWTYHFDDEGVIPKRLRMDTFNLYLKTGARWPMGRREQWPITFSGDKCIYLCYFFKKKRAYKQTENRRIVQGRN